MKKLLLTGVMCGASAVAFGQSASTATADTAANKDDDGALKEIVVTGTLIRGSAPTGSPVVTMDNAAIEATGATNTADLLATVPALTTFNTLPIGGNQEYRSTGATVPGMRGLPGTAVLVLLDGHRLVGDSPLLSTADPSSIPAGAIDHIEIVQDGGSAIYGSDAVAGVINIITKKNFDGFDTAVSYTGAKGYNGASVDQTFGKSWDSGSVFLSGEYESNSDLLNSDRSYYTQDLRPYGGKDGLSTTCGPAQNFSINGVYYNARTLLPQPGSAVTQLATCDPANDDYLVNPSRRYGFIGNLKQDFGDRVHAWIDTKYTDTLSSQLYNPATLSVSYPGLPSGVVIPNTNPFFIAPPGNPTATSETVLVNSGAFGSQGNIVNVYRARSGMADAGANVDLFGDWQLSADFNYGWSNSSALNPDSTGVNPIALYDAENGTTTGTALDPFGGRTNPAVVSAIMNWPLLFQATQRLYDLNVKMDGTVFQLPGGPFKLAVGAANRHEQYNGSDPIGVPGDLGYTEPNAQDASREVNAVFSEASIPIFGKSNALPGLQRLDISLAGRYDHYSDFGSTSNPKYGIVWSPIEDVSFRGSYGTSFHAPQLADIYAIDTRATVSQSTTATNLPPGMAPGVDVVGIAGGKPGLVPETAKTGSMGLDFTPTFIPGFKASATYFLIRYANEVEIPPNNPVNFLIPELAGKLYTYNETAPGVYAPLTPAQLQAVLGGIRSTYPGGLGAFPPIYLVTDLRRSNLGQSDIDGWDFDFHYTHAAPVGSFMLDLSGEYFVKFATQLAPGTPFVNNLTSGLQYYQNDAGAQTIIPWHARFTAGWQNGPFSAQAVLNYTGHYNYAYSAYNYTLNPSGTATPANQWVSPFVTVDLSANWNFPNESGMLKDAKLQLNVYNILDQQPPFEYVTGASGGFASESANPLGRTIRVSFDKKF
jgi:iron complex outermembrane recepter protein